MPLPGSKNVDEGPQSNTTEPALKLIAIDPRAPGDHEAAWRDLAHKSVDPNPFFAPDFLIPLAQAEEEKNIIVHALVNADGEWLMAAPFVRKRTLGLFTRLVSHVSEFGPLGTPLLSRDAPEQTAQIFLARLAETATLVVFRYFQLHNATANALLGSAELSSKVLLNAKRAAHGAGEDGKAQHAEVLASKRYKELARRRRRLAEKGDLVFQSATGAEAEKHYEHFLKLEDASWKGREGTSIAACQKTTTFGQELIARRAAQNGLRIDSMTLDSEPVAVSVTFLEGDRAFSWKIAHDCKYGKFSPGAHLILYTLEQNLANEAIKGADSLTVPGQAMVEPLWRGRVEFGVAVFAKGMIGRLLLPLASQLLELKMALFRKRATRKKKKMCRKP